MNKNDTYKCNVCGNIVQMEHVGGGELVCCNQPMEIQNPNTKEASTEKHIPIYEICKNTLTVTIGSIQHPMTEEHYIEWVDIITTDINYKQFLLPSNPPKAIFENILANNITIRAYCNIHGMWETQINK